MAYQFLNPAPVFPDLLGVDLAAGGSLSFFEIGTTTPQDTWADRAKSVTNANPVPLDSAARSNTPIWLDGAYTVVLKDANGTTIWTRDMTSGVDAGLTIPGLSGNTGYFLSNDGTNLIWAPVLQMPDPTGSTNQVPVTDGSGYVLQNLPEPPEPPEPDWDVGANYFKLGDYFEQWGTGTAPASGTDRTSVVVTFDEDFDTAPHFVGVMVTSTNITGHSLVAIAVTNITTTGCTVTFDNADRHYQGSSKIVNPVPFQWKAEGKRADPV